MERNALRRTAERTRRNVEQRPAERTGRNAEQRLIYIRKLAEEARRYFPGRTAYFARIVGVDYRRITIRSQKTRWGSCSSLGGLNFNCLLMQAPEEIRDYVIVHELCHRLEMNHSRRFWAEVERVMPDYKTRRKWLKDHGTELMAAMYT